MTQEIKKLAAAIDVIASFFDEDYTHVDPQTGMEETRNAYAFMQTRVLNGLCYQLASVIDYTETQTLKNAQRRLRTLLRDSEVEGDVKVQAEIDKTLVWIERLQEQMLTAQSALDVAKAGYLKATGEEFSYNPGGRGAPARIPAVGQSEAQKRIAAALGVKAA